MDSFAFDDFEDFFEQERPMRATGTRSKPVKRKWREIETLKDRARLAKELKDIDILGEYDNWEFDL